MEANADQLARVLAGQADGQVAVQLDEGWLDERANYWAETWNWLK